MPTPSLRMNLALPSQPDDFETIDVHSNWAKLDAAPGEHICTSSTRPAWTPAQIGRKIYETDTDLEWRWTGTQFVRVRGSGLLRLADGSPAHVRGPNAVLLGAGDTWYMVRKITGVIIPAGNRPLRISVNITDESAFFGGAGKLGLSIRDSATANAGNQLEAFYFSAFEDDGSTDGLARMAGTHSVVVPAGAGSGARDFSLQARWGGSALGTIVTPSIWVEEL